MPKAPPLHRPTPAVADASARCWYIADLDGKTLGRACTTIASVIRGKHRPTFVPHQDGGDFVVVINADKIKLSGNKWDEKMYHDHSLYPGGLKSKSAKQLMARHPTELVARAVQGMLPKGPLGRRLVKKLKVYAGAEHPHQAQQPKSLSV
jgi:large subunit ribosomal protein L13